MTRFLAALALVCATALPASAGQTYQAVVVRPVDGDTLVVSVPAWSTTPFGTVSVRVAGIDTPESRKPPAKCKTEVTAGKAASAFGRGLIRSGDPVTLTWRGFDKYGGRIDAAVTLPDGRDWATVMLSTGMARPYAGKTKSSWCGAKARAAAGGS